MDDALWRRAARREVPGLDGNCPNTARAAPALDLVMLRPSPPTVFANLDMPRAGGGRPARPA
jgi:hypothetical protein